MATYPPQGLKNLPIVSVVIPAHDSESWLPLTLRSACGQTLRDIEILVIDDGSTDGTASLVRELAAKDPRIRLIQRENGGVGAARNTGIREARGKYIAPLDADDLWDPEKLEAQVECMEAGGEEMGLVYCWLDKIDGDGKLLASSFPWELEGRILKPLILRNFIGNASVPMFRRSCLDQVGLYLESSEQEGSQGCEDWDLSLRLAEKFDFGLVRRSLVGYRQLADCMSLNVGWMSRSYEIAMRRARARNPDLPEEVFRWSAGNFYSYLVSKCFLWNEYRDCLLSIHRAVSADPILLTNRRFHAMGLKSLVRLVTGTRRKEPEVQTNPAPPVGLAPPLARRSTWSEKIQAKRWESVQNHNDHGSCGV